MPVPSLRVRTCPGAQPAPLSLASLISLSVVSGTFIPSLAAGLPARPPSLQFPPPPSLMVSDCSLLSSILPPSAGSSVLGGTTRRAHKQAWIQ